jgi:hypothetical protein
MKALEYEADEELVVRVHGKRAEVYEYLKSTGRRSHLLVNLTVVGGAVAAALTAAPALGGKRLTDWLTEAFGLSAPSWRVLCAVACVCSVIATVATQMHASHNYEDHITRAQGVKAALEVLEMGLASGTVNRQQAATQFRRCIEGSSFMDTPH